MKFTTVFFLMIVALSSCMYMQDQRHVVPIKKGDAIDHVKMRYTQFHPTRIENVTVEGLDIEDAFKLDSMTLLSAYSHGDLETSNTPSNWGDRLVLMKGDSIQYQSTPVGDPYQYQPFFYKNPENGKIVIICLIGNEESDGGEAFLYENGTIEFMGDIRIECPHETTENTGLIDMIRISELYRSVYIDFASDSLIHLTNNDRVKIKNSEIRYVYTNHTFTLLGR